MRRIFLFLLLACGATLAMADDASARCRHRCRHHCCHSCCYTCCTPCAPCCRPACPTCCYVGGHLIMAQGQAPATIVVHLPADANLTVDGQGTSTTSGVRTFQTPNLLPGQNYSYTLRAQLPSGQVQTQQVTFTSGQQVAVNFDFPGVAVTQR